MHDNLPLDCYQRLATPADLGLPMYTDLRQAQEAQQQEEQISRRLGRPGVGLERIVLAIKFLETETPGVQLPIGGGVVVTAIQITGDYRASGRRSGSFRGVANSRASRPLLILRTPAAQRCAACPWPRPSPPGG